MTVKELALLVMEQVSEDTLDEQLRIRFQYWVVDIVDELCTDRIEWEWKTKHWSFDTEADKKEYVIGMNGDTPEIPPAFQVNKLKHTVTNRVIDYVMESTLHEDGYDLDETGDPLVWYWGDFDEVTKRKSIRLYKIPSSVVTIGALLRLEPKDLGETDEVPVPREFNHAIKLGVEMRFLRAVKDYEGAGQLLNSYLSALARLRNRSLSSKNFTRRYRPTDIRVPTQRKYYLPPY